MNKQVEFCSDARSRQIAGVVALMLGGALTSCGGSSHHAYSISGTVVGLSGTGLVLQANATDDLAVSKTGTFIFFQTLSRWIGVQEYDFGSAHEPNSILRCYERNRRRDACACQSDISVGPLYQRGTLRLYQ